MPIPDTLLKPAWFERTLAAIHLLGVVSALEPMVAGDPEAADLAGAAPWKLGLRVGGGPSVALVAEGLGRLRVVEGLACDPTAVLTFLTPGHLNRTFRKAEPTIPPFTLRGLFHLDLAKKFEALMERAETYLKPGGSRAGQVALRAAMLLQVARGGLAALVRYDEAVRAELPSVPKGLAALRLAGTGAPAVWIDTSGDPWRTGGGTPSRPADVTLIFRSPEVAADAFDDRLDTAAAVGQGEIVIKGWIPLAEALNHLLERLQPYLLESP